MSDKTPWIFPFAVGLIIGIVAARWSDITALWTNRQQISGAAQVAAGLKDLGVGL